VYVLESVVNPDRHYTGIRQCSPAAAQRRSVSTHGEVRPWRVLVTIEFSDHPAAVRFERYLKSGSGRAFAKKHLTLLSD